MNRSDLEARHVLVSGGAGAIEQTCAQNFLVHGAHVTLVDVDKERLERMRARLDSQRVTTVVSLLEDAQACAQAASESGRALHAQIHMAGVFEEDHLDPKDRSVWNRVIANNLRNAHEMVLAFRSMRYTRGPSRVVLCSSRAFQRGTPNSAAYATAKGGIVGLAWAFSRDLAPYTLVNAVSPGLIRTPMTEALVTAVGDQRLAEIVLVRFGEPDEVAGVVGYLCSDAANYVTGQVIPVDGGVINQ